MIILSTQKFVVASFSSHEMEYFVSFGLHWRVLVGPFTLFLVNVQDGYIEAKVMQSQKYDFSFLVPDSECFYIENVFIV